MRLGIGPGEWSGAEVEWRDARVVMTRWGGEEGWRTGVIGRRVFFWF